MPQVKSKQRRCCKRKLYVPFHSKHVDKFVVFWLGALPVLIANWARNQFVSPVNCMHVDMPIVFWISNKQQQNKFVWTLVLFNKWIPLSCSFGCQLSHWWYSTSDDSLSTSDCLFPRLNEIQCALSFDFHGHLGHEATNGTYIDLASRGVVSFDHPCRQVWTSTLI